MKSIEPYQQCDTFRRFKYYIEAFNYKPNRWEANMNALCRMINYTFLALSVCVFFDWNIVQFDFGTMAVILLFCLSTAAMAAGLISLLEYWIGADSRK